MEWTKVLTEQTKYYPLPSGGQDVVHEAPKCMWDYDKGAYQIRNTYTFAMGLWLQLDYWVEQKRTPGWLKPWGINVRLMFKGEGPRQAEYEKDLTGKAEYFQELGDKLQ